MRVFLFKYYGNTLGINSRITHINPEINGGCTFCTLAGELPPPPSETFAHIFFDCRFVYEVLEKAIRKFLGDVVITKELYFLGKKMMIMNKSINPIRFFSIPYGTVFGEASWKKKG
jgi:hypothetical protein